MAALAERAAADTAPGLTTSNCADAAAALVAAGQAQAPAARLFWQRAAQDPRLDVHQVKDDRAALASSLTA